MAKQIFVNLPVRDLAKSKEFWTKLGFSFNPKFTDEKAACLVIEEGSIYAMLLTEPFFKSFTKKEIADTGSVNEVINAISVDSREVVDGALQKVLEAGGTEPRGAEDHGWMYNRAFLDLDGHYWEVFYMDMANVPQNPGASQPQ